MSILVTLTQPAGVTGAVSLRKSWQPSCERHSLRREQLL